MQVQDRRRHGAQSLSISDSNSSPSRTAITAMPWRPTSPDSRMTSPARTLDGATTASCSMRPMPAVLM